MRQVHRRLNSRLTLQEKAKGAFVSESALHSFDGDKPNSVGVIAHADDHSSHPSRTRDECPANFHSPWCDDTRGFYRAGCPSSVLSCTAWGFSCLANYSASGEILPRLFTLACTLLPKNWRCLFCDTLRHRSFSTVMPASFTRHAAVWCSDFPPASPATRDSPAIICHRRITYHNG